MLFCGSYYWHWKKVVVIIMDDVNNYVGELFFTILMQILFRHFILSTVKRGIHNCKLVINYSYQWFNIRVICCTNVACNAI